MLALKSCREREYTFLDEYLGMHQPLGFLLFSIFHDHDYNHILFCL